MIIMSFGGFHAHLSADSSLFRSVCGHSAGALFAGAGRGAVALPKDGPCVGDKPNVAKWDWCISLFCNQKALKSRFAYEFSKSFRCNTAIRFGGGGDPHPFVLPTLWPGRGASASRHRLCPLMFRWTDAHAGCH